MSNQFKVGDEVGISAKGLDLSKLTSKYIDQNFDYGTIKFIDDSENIGVKYGYNNRIELINSNRLYNKADVLKQKEISDETLVKLEESILEDVKKGIAILQGAISKAEDQDFSLIEMDHANSLLRGLINDLGWSSSSLSC